MHFFYIFCRAAYLLLTPPLQTREREKGNNRRGAGKEGREIKFFFSFLFFLSFFFLECNCIYCTLLCAAPAPGGTTLRTNETTQLKNKTKKKSIAQSFFNKIKKEKKNFNYMGRTDGCGQAAVRYHRSFFFFFPIY